MSARRVLRVTGAAASHLLQVTHESSDALLPLKHVAGDALYITNLVMKFRTSKREWKEFSTYVRDTVATIIGSLGAVEPHQTDIIDKLEKLKSMLDEVKGIIESKQHEGFGSRLLHFLGHLDMIAELKKKINDAVELLKFDLAIKIEIKVDKTLRMIERNGHKLSKAALGAARSKLRYVEGASWDPDRVCLENTRKNVIEEIVTWVDSATDSRTENILLLTGVAGAGKSTVAHTISQHYHSRKQLVTSFFFDRETNERNNPKQLIGTIATDLCQTDEQLANRILRALEEDEGVASAPISRQFDELVLKPCQDFTTKHPLVIVLDGLDEGYDQHLLTILSRRVPQLPHRICFVVTTRTLPQLDILHRQPHVHEVELDIHTPNSIDDVGLFISHRLKQVAEYHRLGDHWADHELVDLFKARAGGLFLWVATICDYLLTRSNPTNEFHKLVSTSHTANLSAESRMDKLYNTILDTCDWDDDDFVEDYHRLMGAAVACKTPLTICALARLYQHIPVVANLTRRQLSPLLTGLGDDKGTQQLVRFLHQSLRDFLTLRASSSSLSPDNPKFTINEKTHSQTLALLCLGQMNRELNGSIPGAGYLAESVSVGPGIPNVSENPVSEELWYACRFWVDHILDVELPLSPPMLKCLEEFLDGRLIWWMELMAAYGHYEGLLKLQDWVKGHAMEGNSVTPLVFNQGQGSVLCSLAGRLDYMGRLEEALTAAKEGVEVYRKLTEDAPSESREGLSSSLNTLSIQLHKLGYHEDALKASEEAVTLRQQLAVEQPAVFAPDLALSMNDLSIRLSNLGRHEEALKATEEAVKLRRQFASERPEEFAPALATSLHNLSAHLAIFERHEEALEAIEEAVELYRPLASERPKAFASRLATAVQELSIDLASLGRYEEALKATEEAVKLRRQLASERPAAFTSELAYSVHELSGCYSDLGRHEEALEAIEEAVKLRRHLASERPAAFTPDLASSLHDFSAYLHRLDRSEEALNVMEEAVKLRRQLVSERPAAFAPDLARSLQWLVVHYHGTGAQQKALATVKESVELYRPFAEKYPARYGSDYSNALLWLETCSCTSGFIEEASPASTELDGTSSAEH